MASDDPTAAAGGPKIKLLCSSGGRILPRPSDNSLRYVGGDTRIVSLRRHQTLPEILRKLSETPALLRYQLPDEDLDALISVSTQEDLDNMFDEYDKLTARDPSAKLRVFIFPANEAGIGNSLDCYFGGNDLQDVSAKYLEAVNGVERKDSVASFSSNGEDGVVGHSVVSPTCGDNVRNSFTVKNDVDLPTFCNYGDQSDIINASQPAGGYLPQVFVDPHPPVQFINPHQPYVMLGMPPHVNVVGMPTTQQTNVAISQSMQVSSGVMSQVKSETNLEGSNNGAKMPRPPSDPKLQPLSQLPPLPPPHLLAPSVARQGQLVSKGQGTTGMPHAFSDPLFSESASGTRGSVFEAKPVLQSHHSDNNMTRNRGTQAMTSGGVVDAHQLENLVSAPSLESYGFKEASLEVVGGNERPVVLNVESLSPHSVASNVDNHEQAKLFSQPGSVLVPSKHLISPSLSQQDESVQDHIQLVETIGLAKNPVKQDTIADTVAAGVVFGESSASQHSQFMHENFPVPANSNVYTRPMVPISDTLFLSTAEASVFSQPLAAVVSPENGTTIELKPKISQLIDNNQNFKPQSQVSVLPIYTPVVPSGSILEQNASPPAEPLLPTTSNYVYIQNIHPPNVSYVSHVAGSNVYSYLDAVVGTTGLPSYAYDNTTSGPSMNPVGGMKDMDPNFQYNEAFSNPKLPASGNPQINLAKNAPHQEKLQESATSNSLFFNDDPQKILGSSSELSARSNISNKESVFLKDMHPENISTDKKGLDLGLSEGNLTAPPPNSQNKDLLVETAWPLQGSEQEHVEQDMRVSTEGKKAPGLSLSKPPRAVLNTPESKGSSTVNGENENNVKIDDGKNENTKAKQSDKASYGFPKVDDLGHHLQVIRNDDLEELLELGSGTFGTVYHGKWRGTDVAIKRLNDRVFSGKQSEQERARLDFLNEASKLASLHHPNVVAFYGIVLDGPGGVVATVTEYMVNGSLRNALQNNDRIRDRRPRLIIAMDVAFGMEYLHNRDIIHFDLKSDNLLVNLRDPQRPICKVGDLGLSKLKYETLMSGGMRGTLPWMAPEILGGKKHTEKVDVFSFGIVMWELLTGEEPYADLHYGAIIGGIINNTLRPSVPESCDPEWRSLMEQCWSNDPSDRPSFTEIAGKLRQMAASLPQKK